MDTEQKRTYDKKAKKILSNKRILAHILQRVVDELRDKSIEQIVCYMDGDIEMDKRLYFRSTSESNLGKSVHHGILRYWNWATTTGTSPYHCYQRPIRTHHCYGGFLCHPGYLPPHAQSRRVKAWTRVSKRLYSRS